MHSQNISTSETSPKNSIVRDAINILNESKSLTFADNLLQLFRKRNKKSAPKQVLHF